MGTSKNSEKAYRDFCNEIFEQWLQGDEYLGDFKADFDIDSLPEPYWTLRDGTKKLFVLNNNPGHSLKNGIQKKPRIKRDFPGKSYDDVAKAMATYYTSKQFINAEPNAGRRNAGMISFAENLGCAGVENVETFFLHSHDMGKLKFLRKYKDNALVKNFTGLLKNYLKDKVVLAISAVGSRVSIAKDNLNEWVKYQCDIIGLDLPNAKLLPITCSKNVKGKVTSAVLYGGGKYMILTMGSNNLPKITQDKFNILLFR